jgi:PAS domain S-box-containing protein
MNQDPLYQALFNTPVPRIILKSNTPDFTILDFNDAYKLATDIGDRDIKGLSLWEVFNPGDAGVDGAKLLPETLNKAIVAKETIFMDPFRYDIPSNDQERIVQSWWQLEIIPIVSKSDEVESLLITTNNITDLVLSKEATSSSILREQNLTEELAATNEELMASNEELQAAIEELRTAHEQVTDFNRELEIKVEERTLELSTIIMNVPLGLAIIGGQDMRVQMVNKGLYSLWNKDEQVIGKRLIEAFPELKGQGFLQLLEGVFNSGVPYSGSNAAVDFMNADGELETRYRDFSYTPLKNNAGEVYAILVLTEDVTEKNLIRQKEQYFNEEITAINEELSASIEELAVTNEELSQSQQQLTEHMQELSTYNLKLIEAEERQRFLLNAIPQQVWTSNPEGSLNYVNDVICRDFGKDGDTIVGEGWQAFIHPEDIHDCLRKWVTALQSGQEYAVEFRLKFNDGIYYWHLGRAVPLIEDGKIILWIGTNTNIELQKHNEYRKDEFISIASHELKTPLTSIKAYNQLNIRKNKDNSLSPYLSKVAEQTVRLEKLISDLLDVTKINAGKMVYDFQPFNFQDMLIDTIEILQHTSEQHEIILEGNTDITYTGDIYRLEQVVNNFLSNAIKYSPDGGKVIVKSKISNENIIVSVQDFGIGIAPESLDKLFERYFRVDSTAMRFDGLGLGLFISSEILRRHQGSFWIESEPNNGSTFFFRLPLESSKTKQINVKTDTFYRDNSIMINCNLSKSRLDVDWIGFQNIETIQHGCMVILDMLKESGFTKIVNDNTHVLGTWAEAAEWVGETWFPMAEAAGLKTLAWVYSPSAFNRLSAKKSIDIYMGNIIVQYFTDVILAEDWINKG